MFNNPYDTLAEAFSKVEHPDDWRRPIDTFVPQSALAITIEAIQYFTATPTTVNVGPNGVYRVRSVGYREGPAGP